MFFFTKAKRAQHVNDYETWIAGGVVPTLNRMDNSGESFATVLIIDGTRVNDVRVYEDGIMPTVISRYGTGGGNVPMIFPIDDAREIEKHQNGTGIGEEGAPAYTLDRQQAPGVGIIHNPSDFANYAQQKVVATLRAGMPAGSEPLVEAFDTYNQTTSDVNQTLRTGSDVDKTGAVFEHNVVRRLTPVECERLQGFPDNWTEGQADSHRYKQCGNAVAVPVVEWIIKRLVEVTQGADNDMD